MNFYQNINFVLIFFFFLLLKLCLKQFGLRIHNIRLETCFPYLVFGWLIINVFVPEYRKQWSVLFIARHVLSVLLDFYFYFPSHQQKVFFYMGEFSFLTKLRTNNFQDYISVLQYYSSASKIAFKWQIFWHFQLFRTEYFPSFIRFLWTFKSQ